MKRGILFSMIILSLLAGCVSVSPPQVSDQFDSKSYGIAHDSAFVGTWRIFSERLFYDIGGGGSVGIPSSRTLKISSDGTWSFGDSKGTWSVSTITDDDWNAWNISSYGPTRKLTLTGWNKGLSVGPVEESDGRIDFIWIIYRVAPPVVQNAGTVWMKFGHS